MLYFKKPELSDRAWIQDLYACCGYRGAEYTFANLYLWSFYYGEICRYKDFLCQRLTFGGVHQYIYPAGCGDAKPVVDRLWEDARQWKRPFVLRSLTKQTLCDLESMYPGKFVITEDRDSYDYLYEIDTLADLAGRKYQAKRNHINRFQQAYPNWRIEVVTADTLDPCRELAERWYQSHADSDADRRALEKAFAHFDDLGFEGIVLLDKDTPLGFSMGNRISPDTFGVNFEKSYADIQGAYALVNREFARYIRSKYPDIRYLNREDDMGLEGLRKAKESYYPVLLEKYIAREIL